MRKDIEFKIFYAIISLNKIRSEFKIRDIKKEAVNGY